MTDSPSPVLRKQLPPSSTTRELARLPWADQRLPYFAQPSAHAPAVAEPQPLAPLASALLRELPPDTIPGLLPSAGLVVMASDGSPAALHWLLATIGGGTAQRTVRPFGAPARPLSVAWVAAAVPEAAALAGVDVAADVELHGDRRDRRRPGLRPATFDRLRAVIDAELPPAERWRRVADLAQAADAVVVDGLAAALAAVTGGAVDTLAGAALLASAAHAHGTPIVAVVPTATGAIDELPVDVAALAVRRFGLRTLPGSGGRQLIVDRAPGATAIDLVAAAAGRRFPSRFAYRLELSAQPPQLTFELMSAAPLLT